MSIPWFYIGLALTSMGLMSTYLTRILTAIAWVILFHHILPIGQRKGGYVMLAIMLLVSIQLPTPKFDHARIVVLRNNYQIVQQGLVKAMVYTTDLNAGLDDIVDLSQETLKPIVSANNFEPSTFETWAKSQNIAGSISIDSYHLISAGHSARRILWEKLQHESPGWRSQLLFGQGMEVQGEHEYLFTCGGLPVTVCFGWLFHWLRRRYYEDTARLIQWQIALALLVFFRFSFNYVRLVLVIGSQLLIEDPKQRWGISTSLLVLFQPYSVVSIAFLIPTALRFLNLFKNYPRKALGSSLLVVLIIQLALNGSAQLGEVLLFNVGRWIGAAAYLVALVTCWIMPLNISNEFFDRISTTLDATDKFVITGRLGLIVAVVLLGLVIAYVESGKIKFGAGVLIAVFLSSIQCYLNPFPTVTMLDVGQGDCTVITLPFSASAIMIDTGGSVYQDISAKILVPYLNSRAIKSVDVIVTHQDYDHNGALSALQTQFSKVRVYKSRQAERTLNGLTIYDPEAKTEFGNDNDNSQLSYFQLGPLIFFIWEI